MNRWALGIDFGQRNDRTALAAIEQVPSPTAMTFLDVRYLERLPLGMSYPDQCARIAALVDTVPELAHAEVIVDASGVGVAVVDTLHEHLRRGFDELTITGASQSGRRGRQLSVPKRDLVSTVAVAMQTGRLRMASGLPDGPALLDELESFGVTISDSGHDSYGARSGHDDLVLALSYATWRLARPGVSDAFLAYFREQGRRAKDPTVDLGPTDLPADPIARARTEALRSTPGFR